MAVNSSSFLNDSFLHDNLPWDKDCLFIRPSLFVFTVFFITSILLLLPLCSFILYLGLQRWRQQRYTSAAAMTSHSDSFTYHMAAMELLNVSGCILGCCSIYGAHNNVLSVGYPLLAFNWYGEIFFHILTCVERYLAVVHPVTYLSLRRERGIRIRNISIGCIWLLCLGAVILTISGRIYILFNFCLLIFSLFVITVCSLSILFVLIRPGPGEQGGDRELVNQSKRRAFYTIMAILVVLWLRCFANLAPTVFQLKGDIITCTTSAAVTWFNIPASLVLPLLFLHRAGPLACCKNNN